MGACLCSVLVVDVPCTSMLRGAILRVWYMPFSGETFASPGLRQCLTVPVFRLESLLAFPNGSG